MAAAFVQQTGSNSGAIATGQIAVGVTNAPTVGNVLVVRAGSLASPSGGEALSVTDSKGNTYTKDHIALGPASPNNSGSLVTFSAKIATALTTSDTITVAYGTNTNVAVLVAEFSGMLCGAESGFDQGAGSSGTSSSPSSGATGTLTGANDMVLGGVFAKTGTAPTAGSGYTLNGTVTNVGLALTEATERLLLAGSTAAQTATFGLSSSVSWVCSVVAYKEVIAGRTIDPFGLIEVIFDASGTWFPPAGVTSYDAEIEGSGSAGVVGSLATASGGGGGAGAYVRSWTTTPTGAISCTPGTGEAVVIGAPGTTSGQAGADSYVKNTSTLLAKGGAAHTGTAAGAGGTAAASIGATKFDGGNGAAGPGGGGGGAGDSGAGGNAVTTTGGTGGSGTRIAGGAGGAAATAVAPGQPGNLYGAGGGGGGTVQTGFGVGVRGRIIIRYREVGNMASVVAPAGGSESLGDTATVTSVVSPAQQESVADTGGSTSVAVLAAGRESIGQDQTLTSIAALAAGSESIGQDQTVTSIVALAAGSEAIRDIQTVTSLAVLAAIETIAQDQTVTSAAALAAGRESIAQDQTLTTIALLVQQWQLISPGLSGVAYDSTGTYTIAGAEVLLFRDDTNVVYAALTADGAGAWATSVDALLTYWVSYWSAQGAGAADNLFGRTDKGIPAVLTVIASGT